MTDETTTSPTVMAGDVITQPGLYESRGGDIVQITGWDEGWWVSKWNGIRTDYAGDGRQRFRGALDTGRWDLLHWVRPLPANEVEPETTTEQLAEIEGQPTEFTPPEGWRLVETHEELDIPGRDQYVRGPNRYIRPIDPQPQPQPADTADELRSEVSYVQNLLGESRQRVTHLEELVTSLRTINVTQKKAFTAAGKENTALQRELAVAKEELTIAAAVSQQLQIELDAAQQVPADSPELRQLQLRLADMTLDRDQCKDAYDRIFADLVTIRETTKAEAVEAIVEWLQPFRGCNSPALALLLLEALPHIMRSLTGLANEEIE